MVGILQDETDPMVSVMKVRTFIPFSQGVLSDESGCSLTIRVKRPMKPHSKLVTKEYISGVRTPPDVKVFHCWT